MTYISLGIAFLAGLLSFLSPCVIPLVPGYLSFLSGMSASELGEQNKSRQIVVPALLFVLGFSLVFIALGASASLLGSVVKQYEGYIQAVGGALVIIFGVLMTGVIKVPWLYGELRLEPSKAKVAGNLSGLFIGMAFAAGWTPCIGPILGTILTMASAAQTAAQGAALLFVYSLGLGVPFMLTAILFSQVRPILSFMQRYSLVINRIAGVLLIIVGVLIISGAFSQVALWLAGSLPSIKIDLPALSQ